jgi:hypothetical protein
VITTTQLQTAITAGAAHLAEPNQQTAPDLKLSNLNLRNVYIGRDNKVHVSNSGFQRWFAQKIGGRAAGAEALKQGLVNAGIAPDVAGRAVKHIRWQVPEAGNNKLTTLGEVLQTAKQEGASQKFAQLKSMTMVILGTSRDQFSNFCMAAGISSHTTIDDMVGRQAEVIQKNPILNSIFSDLAEITENMTPEEFKHFANSGLVDAAIKSAKAHNKVND